MRPGMMLRLDKNSINGFKNAMAEFLPHYLNVDLQLPREYSYDLKLLGYVYKFKWTNIKYSRIKLDIKDISISMQRTSKHFSEVSVDLPAIKDWKITADQEVNSWLIPMDGPVKMALEDFDFDFSCYFELDKKGYLDPVVKDVDLDWGTSYFEFEDFWVELFTY